MNKKFKKICSIVLTFAITAASAINMSVSAIEYKDISDYTIIDDKGMMEGYVDVDEGYKMLYRNGDLYIAEPLFCYSDFVLSEDVDYEEANKRVIEIFKEFYPDNYLGVSTIGMSRADYDEYADNYKPNLLSNTVDGVTTYTLCASARFVRNLNDEKVAAARKYSKAFMEKLNEEKLISEFYDFGEIYMLIGANGNMTYFKNEDIDLVNNYIKENNIDCTIEKKDYTDGNGYYYILKSNDNDALKEFLIAADIYEATSIRIMPIYSLNGPFVYGKNSLEEISDVANSKEVKLNGDANGDGEFNIRDAAFIAIACAKGQYEDIPEWADYNGDGERNIRDAAAIAIYLASK